MNPETIVEQAFKSESKPKSKFKLIQMQPLQESEVLNAKDLQVTQSDCKVQIGEVLRQLGNLTGSGQVERVGLPNLAETTPKRVDQTNLNPKSSEPLSNKLMRRKVSIMDVKDLQVTFYTPKGEISLFRNPALDKAKIQGQAQGSKLPEIKSPFSDRTMRIVMAKTGFALKD